MILVGKPEESRKLGTPTIQINQPTRRNNLSSLLVDVIYSSIRFGRPHGYFQELNNCSSSLWFYCWSVVTAVLLVVVGPPGPTTTNSTATVIPKNVI
jgi:hypothetical protein